MYNVQTINFINLSTKILTLICIQWGESIALFDFILFHNESEIFFFKLGVTCYFYEIITVGAGFNPIKPKWLTDIIFDHVPTIMIS